GRAGEAAALLEEEDRHLHQEDDDREHGPGPARAHRDPFQVVEPLADGLAQLPPWVLRRVRRTRLTADGEPGTARVRLGQAIPDLMGRIDALALHLEVAAVLRGRLGNVDEWVRRQAQVGTDTEATLNDRGARRHGRLRIRLVHQITLLTRGMVRL